MGEWGSFNKEDFPWMIISNGGENGILYISAEDHQGILKLLAQDQKIAVLKDKRVINLVSGFQSIIPNPKYIDPGRVAMLRKEHSLWEEYQQLKKSGRFNSMQEFIKWKKTQLSKEELKEMKSLLNNTAETANGPTNKK